MRFRWRRRIDLPGFKIHVRFTDDRGLKGLEGSWEYDMSRGEGTIRIHVGLTEKRKRAILAHELQHAMTDYFHYLVPDE